MPAPPCPYCNGETYRRLDERWLVCQACDHEFDLRQDLCRRCGRLNQADAVECAYCRSPLPKKDLASQVIDVRSKSRRDWLAGRSETDKAQKLEDQEASQRRMEAYWAEEHERQKRLAADLALRREQERRMALVAGGIALLVVIAIVIVAIVLASK